MAGEINEMLVAKQMRNCYKMLSMAKNGAINQKKTLKDFKT